MLSLSFASNRGRIGRFSGHGFNHQGKGIVPRATQWLPSANTLPWHDAARSNVHISRETVVNTQAWRVADDRLRKASPSLAGSHARQAHTQPAGLRRWSPIGGWGALPGLSSRTCCHARAPRGCGDAADAPCGHMTAVSLLLAPLVSMWRWGPATAAR